MQDSEIAAKLAKLPTVRTVVRGVVNEIRDVEAHAVVVRSELTGRDRRVPYSGIRGWKQRGSNGRIRRALARAVGLPGA